MMSSGMGVMCWLANACAKLGARTRFSVSMLALLSPEPRRIAHYLRVCDGRQADKSRDARDEQAQHPGRANVHLAGGFDLAGVAHASSVQCRVLDRLVQNQELDRANKVVRELIRLRAQDLRRQDRVENAGHGSVQVQVGRCPFAIVQREEEYRMEEKRRAFADLARVAVERSREQARPRLDVMEEAEWSTEIRSVVLELGLSRLPCGMYNSNSASHSS